MLEVDKDILVPYTPSQMYDLVNDIEQYPLFLPWCPKTEVHKRDESIIQATVFVAKGNIQQAFTTQNSLKLDEEVHMQLVSGPFKHLEGWWRFSPRGEAKTKVSFKLQFEFSNKLVQMVFGQVFHKITEKMLQAFVERAEDIYGTK